MREDARSLGGLAFVLGVVGNARVHSLVVIRYDGEKQFEMCGLMVHVVHNHVHEIFAQKREAQIIEIR